MKVCQEYKKKVEEKIEEPLKTREQGARKKCKKKKCKWWCACCNKWFCWIETFFYWVVRWIVTIVIKWVPYLVCRIISAFITLLFTILVVLKWIDCNITGIFFRGDYETMTLDNLPLKTLHVEVVIIDKDENTPNPITNQEIEDRIRDADRILKDQARIEVKLKGEIRRDISASLWKIDASSIWASIGEWFKAIFLLIGRDSPRNLTVYAIRSIEGADGLHQPLYGSVFIEPGSPDTTLCHEIGHALLSIDKMGHSDRSGNLMHTPAVTRQQEVGWPTGIPTLTQSQWCGMRKNRWLDWTWSCERCGKMRKTEGTRLTPHR